MSVESDLKFNENNHYTIRLASINEIVASEITDPISVSGLRTSIFSLNIWTTALPIEKRTGWVMDGNHRLCVAKILKLRYLPVIDLCYSDPRIRVTHFGSDLLFDTRELQKIIEKRELLPYKSTKHQFFPDLPMISLPLNALA